MSYEHVGVLYDHVGVLYEHVGVLYEHVGVLYEHVGVLYEHVGVLYVHVGVLYEHVDVLNDHVGVLWLYVVMSLSTFPPHTRGSSQLSKRPCMSGKAWPGSLWRLLRECGPSTGRVSLATLMSCLDMG